MLILVIFNGGRVGCSVFSFAASFAAAGCTAAEIMLGLRRLWRLPARQPRMRRAGVGASASAAAAARAVGCAPAALAAAAKIVLSKLSRPMLARPAASEASAAAAAGARAARGASAAVESMRDVGGAAHVTAAAPLIPCEAPAMSPSRYIVNPVSPPRVARKPTLYAPTSAAAASTARSWRRPLRLPSAAALRAAAGTRFPTIFTVGGHPVVVRKAVGKTDLKGSLPFLNS